MDLIGIFLIALVLTIAIAGLYYFGPALWQRYKAPVTTKVSGWWRSRNAPSHIRKIGMDYGVNVTGQVGTTAGRVAVYALFGFLVFLLSLRVVGMFTVPFGIGAPYPHFIALAITAFAAIFTIPYFVVNVPKLTGLILTNYFGGAIHVMGPGLNVKYPWEYYSLDDYIDIRAISVEKLSKFIVPGKTVNDKSGGAVGVTFKWTVQYGPYLPLLPLYVRTEWKAIEDGFEEVVENAINEAILGKTIDQVLKKETVDELQKKLEEVFLGVDEGSRDVKGNTLQERFGLMVELNTLGPPEFDKDYSEALAARVARAIITEDAEEMADSLDISPEKALQTIMMLNKENVSEQILTLNADKQIAALAPILMKAVRDLGDAGRGMQATAGRKGSRKSQGGSAPAQGS